MLAAFAKLVTENSLGLKQEYTHKELHAECKQYIEYYLKNIKEIKEQCKKDLQQGLLPIIEGTYDSIRTPLIENINSQNSSKPDPNAGSELYFSYSLSNINPNYPLISNNSENINYKLEGQGSFADINTKLQEIGLTLLPIYGDGHCLYRAVSIYIEKDVETLRREVAQKIRENVDNCQEIIEALIPMLTIEDYISSVEIGDEWADNLEIAILMKVLNRPIIIIDKNNCQVKNYTDASTYIDEDPIFVLYNGIDHYDALIKTGQIEARAILSILGSDTQQPNTVEEAQVNQPYTSKKIPSF